MTHFVWEKFNFQFFGEGKGEKILTSDKNLSTSDENLSTSDGQILSVRRGQFFFGRGQIFVRRHTIVLMKLLRRTNNDL